VFALIVTKNETPQNTSRARLKQRGWKTMVASAAFQAAKILEENEGVFDVVIVDEKDIGPDLSALIRSVREVAERIPVFVIAESGESLHANRRLLPDSVYVCQALDTECVDQMIDGLGLSAPVKLFR
jgi:DNA-binding NtrC family response regulator